MRSRLEFIKMHDCTYNLCSDDSTSIYHILYDSIIYDTMYTKNYLKQKIFTTKQWGIGGGKLL